MKRRILCTVFGALLLVFPARAFGQDVTNPTTSQYLTLARGNSWGTGGTCANGPGCGVNNVYVWTPPTPDSTVCVAVTNLNPTNAHNVTLALNQTLDASVTGFSGNQGAWAAVPIAGTTFPVSILANSTTSFFFRSSSAARLALQVTGTSTAAGSPDTANITVVQPSTASWCGSAGSTGTIVEAIGTTPIGTAIPAIYQQPVQVGGQNVTGANYGGNAEVLAIDATTKGLSIGSIADVVEGNTALRGAAINSSNGGGTSFAVLHVFPWGKGSDVNLGSGAGDQSGAFRNSIRYGTAVTDAFGWASDAIGNSQPLRTFGANSTTANPAAGAMLFSVTVQAAGNGLDPHNLVMSCSAACDMIVNKISTNGTTCGALTPYKTGDPSQAGPATTSTAQQAGCAANPTVVQQLWHFYIAAGTTQVFNMSGYYYLSGATAAQGFDVVEGGALTGNASVTVDWMER